MKQTRIASLAAMIASVVFANSAQAQLQSSEPVSAGIAAYWSAKAQCWADLAAAERSQRDTHGTAVKAAGNASRIEQALRANQVPAYEAEQPIFARKHLPSRDSRYGRPKWRDDVEYIDETLRRYAERRCRTSRSGCLEVAQQSVYENMEETAGARWNHGHPEIDHALSLAKEAAAEFESACAPPLTSAASPVAPLELAKPLETIELPADTLFRFDQWDGSGLLPGGREAIADLVVKIHGYGRRAASLSVVGHTDRLGPEHYNQILSQRRAMTVAALLRGAGVGLPIADQGVGSTEPFTGDSCKGRVASKALVECLQPDRRVVVRILPAP
jgi:outer membrane protein OmpA-like peptidoglycan-associated protein